MNHVPKTSTRHFTHILLYILLSAITIACDSSDKKVLGKAISAPNELLVVCDKNWLETSQAETFRDLIYADMPCLPSQETAFKVTKINPAAFSGKFQYYALIIKTDISSEHKTAEVTFKKDEYCRQQLIVNLVAPDFESFQQLCVEQKDNILELLNKTETERNVTFLENNFSGITQRMTKKLFGCDVHAPAELNSYLDGKDFLWTSSEGNHDNYYNFCVYSYPLPADLCDIADSTEYEHALVRNVLNEEKFLSKRDSVMKPNIIGEEMAGQIPYMTTVHEAIITKLKHDADGSLEMFVRGLWAMEYEAMGGPYVSRVIIDRTNKRVLTAEGFVFAPNKKKRDYVRKLEAALNTFKIVK